MASVLILEKHKGLFKDEDAFRQFADVLSGATEEDDMRLVLYGEKLVGAFISQEAAQEQLRTRILTRLMKNPAVLDTLREKLESDDLVT